MNIISYPSRAEWADLLQRPVLPKGDIEARVQSILDAVREGGDEALLTLARQFDKFDGESLEISRTRIEASEELLAETLKKAIRQAGDNIRKFHETQRQPVEKIETVPGVTCWRKSVGIEKVGIYIPGGSAPLFSTVLMLAIPAQLAGCKEIILCTPSDHPAILYSAKITGVTRIFRIGGAQAIAALAYGTETIPRVYKIFGPGNQFVTNAKLMVAREGVAIDMPAGPSEVAIWADESAVPSFIAADLLSQAEHGPDSQVILVSTSREVISEVAAALSTQLEALPRKDIAHRAIGNSKAFLVDNGQDALDLINAYAPEHLILSIENAESVSEKVINAGSVFLGNYTPESCGDYASGTNHTLPTNGHARAYSGVSLDSFTKKITFQHITPAGLQLLGPTVEAMAEAETLTAHKRAVSIRLSTLN
ncbi:MAG: histidinol dehydrogenase [Cytophagaceae bacterium SCN 52-12]|nr:MAG: histidinol dehydrogenase [Cytophagaceae bacterium SCN 52-12]